MNTLLKLLEINPIIAAVRDGDDFKNALKSPASVIFSLSAVNVLNIETYVKETEKNEKALFLHIDMADGIGKDPTGLSYIAKCGVRGIISTRSSLIKSAREAGLMTVQRFFMVDSRSIATACENIKQSKPDLVELMPGIMPKVISDIKKRVGVPLIAGGLIETKENVIEALGAGASGISTGKSALWYE